MPQNDCHIENPVNTDHIYQKDCFAVSLSFVTEHATLLGTIAVAISCVMVIYFYSNSFEFEFILSRYLTLFQIQFSYIVDSWNGFIANAFQADRVN